MSGAQKYIKVFKLFYFLCLNLFLVISVTLFYFFFHIPSSPVLFFSFFFLFLIFSIICFSLSTYLSLTSNILSYPNYLPLSPVISHLSLYLSMSSFILNALSSSLSADFILLTIFSLHIVISTIQCDQKKIAKCV